MKDTLLEILLLAFYTAIVLMAFRNISPVYAPWFSTVMSLVLISVYYIVGIRKYVVPLLAILFTTIIFPLGVLVAMGIPVYGSLGSSATSLLNSMVEHPSSWLPQFVALLASLILVLLLKLRVKP